MKYLWYAFLGLFSLGFLGMLAAVGVVFYTFSFYASDLPDHAQLKDYEPPIVTRIYAGDGRLMAEFAQEKRVFVPIENMPALVKQAFIAAEDQNFYTHEGVDPMALVRAASVYARHLMGQDVTVIGGSTITQQVVKNFLLTNERSFERKIKEAILAHRMEQAMSKDRILELYLNQIYLGARSYGVAAAALQYFNKSLEDLNIAEMAYLAALPKAPNNYNPQRHYDAALERRNWVIRRMLEDKYITAAEAKTARESPLEVIDSDGSGVVRAPYFSEEVRRDLGDKYGQDSLYKGGLAVRTTIDPALQEIAVDALRDGLMSYDQRHGYRGPIETFDTVLDWETKLSAVPRPAAMLERWDLAVVLEAGAAKAKIGFQSGAEGELTLAGVQWARKYINQGYQQGPEIKAVTDVLQKGDVVMVEPEVGKKGQYVLRQPPDVQGAIIALDPHTGRVLAMQGGWTYGISEFNRATQAKRQPGSAFKPFVYLAALDNGFTPATLVMDAPFVIEDRPGHFWSPTNYSNEYYGPTPIRVGVEKSRNLMTVRLAHHLGIDKIVEYSKRFGIDEHMQPNLSNALGAGETTLLQLTAAYAVLVNGGKKIVPSFIDRIQDRRGSTIFRHDERQCGNCGALIRWDGQNAPDVPDIREQIADPRTAYQMVSILEGVVQRGTGVKLKELGRPLAGKTGTTNESKDTWFIGFSPDLVVGVFVGFDEPRSMGKRETGSSAALPIFKTFMEQALKDQPILPFRMPPGIRNVQINATTGARAQPGDAKVIWEAFVTGTEPTGDTYILDEGGIRLMNGQPAPYDSYSDPYRQNDEYAPGPGAYTPNEENGYSPSSPGGGIPSPPDFYPRQPTPANPPPSTQGIY
ncbi:MAG: penicillin-binding protein 1A [Alphaproteobacteria bacterium]|nr:penicillin-binding protein 1A [Alphaproteobacteria bacterium]